MIFDSYKLACALTSGPPTDIWIQVYDHFKLRWPGADGKFKDNLTFKTSLKWAEEINKDNHKNLNVIVGFYK